MGFIAEGIEDGRRIGKERAKPVDDQAFQIAGRYTPAGRTVASGPRDEGGRDIVPISCSPLDRVGRCQALAGRVKYQSGKQARMFCAQPSRPLDPVPGQGRLDFIPQWLVDDRRMFSEI